MDSPKAFLSDVRNPEKVRLRLNLKLCSLNDLIREEHLKSGTPESEIPVITIELFEHIRGEDFADASRELPRQMEIRRRDLVKGLLSSVVVTALSAKIGAMTAGTIFRDKLEKLVVREDQLKYMSYDEIQRRESDIIKIMLPGALLGGGTGACFTLYCAVNGNRMSRKSNAYNTQRFLGMLSLIFNLKPGEILQLTDIEIEEKMRQLKHAGCELEDMLDLLSTLRLGEYMRDGKNK